MLNILDLLVQYHVVAIFIGSFFFAETVVISAAFLAGQGLWGIETVFLFSLLGTIAADTAWYCLGLVTMKKWLREGKLAMKYNKFIAKIDAFAGRRPFIALLFIKFAYGTRTIMMMYLSTRRLGFPKFMGFDIIGTTIWLLVMLPIGYFAGLGTAGDLDVIHDLKYTAIAIVIFMIAFRFTYQWAQKKLFKA